MGVNQRQIEKKGWKLNVNKASQIPERARKVVEEITDIFSNFLWNSFNNFMKLSTFPEILRCGDITSLYKRRKKDIKGNYRSASNLPNLSKIFEKYMFKQNVTFIWEYIFEISMAMFFGNAWKIEDFWLPRPWAIHSKLWF